MYLTGIFFDVFCVFLPLGMQRFLYQVRELKGHGSICRKRTMADGLYQQFSLSMLEVDALVSLERIQCPRPDQHVEMMKSM